MQSMLVGLLKVAGLIMAAPFVIVWTIITSSKGSRKRKERREDEQFKKDQRELTKLQLDRERRQAMEDKRRPS